MARVKTGKGDKVQAAAQANLKPIRVDLDPEIHRIMRMEAAKAGMSMARFARKYFSEMLVEMSKRK